MAVPKSHRDRTLTKEGFDVVCTIGRVTFGEGEVSPMVAALTMIGEHNAPGDYSFPNEWGGDVTVTIPPFPERNDGVEVTR